MLYPWVSLSSMPADAHPTLVHRLGLLDMKTHGDTRGGGRNKFDSCVNILHIIINNKMGSTEPLSGISDIYGHSGSVNLYMQSISQITFLNLYKKVFSFKLLVSDLLITILYFKCVLRNVASGIQHFFHIYWLSLTCLICRTNGCQLKISLDFVLSL